MGTGWDGAGAVVVDVEMDVEQALPEVDGTVSKGMAMESAYCSKRSTRCCRRLQVWRPRRGGAAARETNRSRVMESALNISKCGKLKSSWNGNILAYEKS